MEIRVGAEPATLAATWVARRIRDSVRRRDSSTIALSGGSTAPAMIATLLEADLPWDAVGVWQVDERVAPDGDPARNAEQLAGIAERGGRVRLMPVTAADQRAAARRYAATLPDVFDIVHLGIGSDGHTASWPPGNDGLRDSERSVETVETFNGWERMTITRRVVNHARSRVVLATGASKRPVVERWLLGDRALPVTGVLRTRTWVFLDPDAAPSATMYPLQ